MPHLKHDLLRHEYDKRVQCFDLDAEKFFDTELQMRCRVVDSALPRAARSTPLRCEAAHLSK